MAANPLVEIRSSRRLGTRLDRWRACLRGPVALASAALLVVWGQDVRSQTAPRPSPASGGTWITVGERNNPTSFPAVGSFRARQATRLGVQVPGRVQQVLVDVGDLVHAGQELLKLDPEFFQIEVAQRKAELDAAAASLKEAELNLSRMKSLFEKPAGETPSVSRKQYDDAQIQYQSASARLRGAEGALHYARKRLDEAVVRAPFNAVVTKRMVDPGEPANASPITYVLEVQEVEVLDLEFSLPQDMLGRIKKGTPLTYEVEGVSRGKGRAVVSVIYPALDEATRSFRCRATVDNPDLRLKPGMLAQVNVLEGAGPGTVTVPRGALTQTAEGWQVQVSEGSRTVTRRVKVGAVTDQTAEIQDGLRAGERIWVPGRG